MVREGELVARDWEEWYREERKAIEDVPNMDAILFICFFLCVVIFKAYLIVVTFFYYNSCYLLVLQVSRHSLISCK